MKNKTFKNKKSAFSLIELSIVLIIIGLLIAAITGGASLVKSSELRAVMGEARGWQVAVNSFYSQFDALPGDYGIAIGNSGTSAVGVNGNRQIAFATENHIAWLQLKNATIIDDNLVPLPVTAVSTVLTIANGATGSMPASKARGAGWAFDYISRAPVAVTAAPTVALSVPMNAVILTAPNTSRAAPVLDINESTTIVNDATIMAANAALTTIDALSIDTKADDGVANSGRIIGINAFVSVAAATLANSCTAITGFAIATIGSSSPSYRTSFTTAPSCALAFQVDPNT